MSNVKATQEKKHQHVTANVLPLSFIKRTTQPQSQRHLLQGPLPPQTLVDLIATMCNLFFLPPSEQRFNVIPITPTPKR